MKSQYASTPTGDEMELNDLELQDVRIASAQSRTLFNTQEKQRQLLRE